MQYFSQRDPAICMTPMPLSNLLLKDAGCYVCSIATLGQVDVLSLLKTPGGFVQGGYLISPVIAHAAGMAYMGISPVAPKGWCIGRADAYTAHELPTYSHFLCVNATTHEMVDPLRFPAKVEPLTYVINQYCMFSNVKLSPPVAQPPFAVPAVPSVPDWAAKAVERAKRAGVTTPLTDTIGSMPTYQLLLLIEKYLSVPPS